MTVISVSFVDVRKAEASWMGSLLDTFTGQVEATEKMAPAGNSQTLGLQSSVAAVFASTATSTSKFSDRNLVTSGGALLADTGPMGTIADVPDEPESDQISLYVVRVGDSLSEIAEMYNVSVNTIAWANNMSAKTALKEGQLLVILPVSGIQHTVIKGETVASIAKKYGGDAEEIVLFNGLEGVKLVAGQEIIIPNGEVAPVKASTSGGKTVPRGNVGPSYAGYYMRPVATARRTQGLHGYNGIDLAAPVGTQVVAAAAGRVILSRGDGGYNGGYGNYIVIEHPNKTQTLYAHLSKTLVTTSQAVSQGQLIGQMGSTGRSTGSHLHFEIRGAKNPF